MMGTEWTTMKVAQLRYDSSDTWSLYCRDSSERWWLYDGIAPTSGVDGWLAEIGEDPAGIFWGGARRQTLTRRRLPTTATSADCG